MPRDRSADANGPIVVAKDVLKRFPGVLALAGVSLELRSGEIHCLVGENGAGKSTLIKLLSGYYAPDDGVVLVRGDHLVATPTAAQRAGIATIHQEHQLVPDLTARENVLLGIWPSRAGFVRRAQVASAADQMLARVAPSVDGGQLARTLSAAQGQLTEVARGLAQEASVLILDEPTTALGDDDVRRLFDLLRELRTEGLAILYVSHKLEELFQIGDRVTVLRDGRTVSTGPIENYDEQLLIHDMVGEEVELYADHASEERRQARKETPRLVVKGITNDRLQSVDIFVYPGEILGLAGLQGAGRSELARAIFGADPISSGSISIDGAPVQINNPQDAVAAGIGMVPEERRTAALVPLLSVRENVGMALWRKLSRLGFVNAAKERSIAEHYVERLRVRTPKLTTPVSSLSGGNQQKVVIARWLAADPRVLILDEPTKGIDVGAKAEIHHLIRELADEGLGVIVISSELPELLALSDRIAVLRQGRVSGELTAAEADKRSVMRLAVGHTASEDAA